MLFDKLCKIFDTFEKDLDLCGVVEGIFRFGVVSDDITGGKLVVFVADVTEEFEWSVMV